MDYFLCTLAGAHLIAGSFKLGDTRKLGTDINYGGLSLNGYYNF